MKKFFFFFNDTATTEIYTLSLHDALPIFNADEIDRTGEIPQKNIDDLFAMGAFGVKIPEKYGGLGLSRSEEHTSELQSRQYLVCRLLLEKKKKTYTHLPLINSSSYHPNFL